MEISLASDQAILTAYFDTVLSGKFQKFTKGEPTFLEVAGFPDYENVLSNIYAHFLNDRDHELGRLFLTALLRCSNAPGDLQMDAWTTQREISIEAGRIDLLIREDSEEPQKIIVVENKVYHHASDNDFAGYLNEYNKVPFVFGILLTLEPAHEIPSNYINITHQQWLAEVRKDLGNMLTEVPSHKLILLQDFFRHIDRYYKNQVTMDSYKFLFENSAKISALIELRDNAIEQLKEDVRKTVNGKWEPYRSSASSIAFQRNALVMYVTTDKLLNPGANTFQIQLWLKGKKAVSSWKQLNQKPVPPNSIRTHASENTKEWTQIASKDYSIKYEEMQKLGDTVRERVSTEWEGFADEVERVVG